MVGDVTPAAHEDYDAPTEWIEAAQGLACAEFMVLSKFQAERQCEVLSMS